MARNYPTSKDVWPPASFYVGKTFLDLGGTVWPGDVGDQFEAIEDYVGVRGSTDATTLTGKTDWVRTAYTPTYQGYNISTHPATWTGNYSKSGHLGLLSIHGAITGSWSSTGGAYLAVSLPTGWAAQASFHGGVLTGFAQPANSTSWFYPLMGIVGPGATTVRFVTAPATEPQYYPVNGTTLPFLFASGDELHLAGFVILA